MNSIFSKIIVGDIPSHKIYEDEKTFAFLDIYPVTTGHTLVVPKQEIADFYMLSQADYQALWNTVQQVAQRIREVYNPKKVCLKVEGFDVAHAHVHVFPCNSAEEFYRHADHNREPDHQTLRDVAKALQI